MITLDLPPSTNLLYRNVPGKGRVKTAAYKKWRAAAAWQIKAQKIEPVEAPIVLDITVERPDNRKRDISNLIKATEDALVAAGVFADDSLVTGIYIGWANSPVGNLVNVFLRKAP